MWIVWTFGQLTMPTSQMHHNHHAGGSQQHSQHLHRYMMLGWSSIQVTLLTQDNLHLWLSVPKEWSKVCLHAAKLDREHREAWWWDYQSMRWMRAENNTLAWELHLEEAGVSTDRPWFCVAPVYHSCNHCSTVEYSTLLEMYTFYNVFS